MTSVKLFSASVFFAFAASQAVALSADDSFSLRIDATRLNVMMDQSRAALTSLNFAPHDQMLGAFEAEHPSAFAELVSAVLGYNQILQEICPRAIVDAKLCAGAYLPHWLDAKSGGMSD